MGLPLDGVRVLEVATHVFAPLAGAVLAEWGAEVVKVEAPDGGDPYRGLVTAGLRHPEVATDPRFVDMDARRRNAAACVAWLRGRLRRARPRRVTPGAGRLRGEWAPVQTPAELHDDPQVVANGYLPDVDMGGGVSLPLVTSPVQFDERPGRPTRAPEHGEHTESVLLALGLTWDEITALKERGAIL